MKPIVRCAFCDRSFDAGRPFKAAQRARDAHEAGHQRVVDAAIASYARGEIDLAALRQVGAAHHIANIERAWALTH